MGEVKTKIYVKQVCLPGEDHAACAELVDQCVQQAQEHCRKAEQQSCDPDAVRGSFALITRDDKRFTMPSFSSCLRLSRRLAPRYRSKAAGKVSPHEVPKAQKAAPKAKAARSTPEPTPARPDLTLICRKKEYAVADFSANGARYRGKRTSRPVQKCYRNPIWTIKRPVGAKKPEQSRAPIATKAKPQERRAKGMTFENKTGQAIPPDAMQNIQKLFEEFYDSGTVIIRLYSKTTEFGTHVMVNFIFRGTKGDSNESLNIDCGPYKVEKAQQQGLPPEGWTLVCTDLNEML